MMIMTVAFYTLGCKVNTYETQSVWETFKNKGYTRVSDDDYADVYVINTCTVTNQADVKSRKAIRKFIRRNPEAIIAVMGCYTQVYSENVIEIDGVDIVIGTQGRHKLVDLVEEYKRDREQINAVEDVSKIKEFDKTEITHLIEHKRAFIKIQDGCNLYCTYCIIPFARGQVRSRSVISILDEVNHLVDGGVKEIVLTGIHTGAYGRDLENINIVDLIKELIKIEDLKRIRISSIEFNQVSDELLDMIKSNKKIVPHLHIPIQSGSDRILKLMRRRYSKAEYLERINYIRKQVKGIAVTTDIIVGFPGETDDDFKELVETCKEADFQEMHVFPYSKRSGTKAAKMDGHLSKALKTYRVNELINLNADLANQYIAKQDILNVLFEFSDDEYTYGHSENYIMCMTKKDESLHNEIRQVKVEKHEYKHCLVNVI
jgi:threonylcarbamoyladenosine tRNA methylthiotransferase MtaB